MVNHISLASCYSIEYRDYRLVMAPVNLAALLLVLFSLKLLKHHSLRSTESHEYRVLLTYDLIFVFVRVCFVKELVCFHL